MTEFSVCLEKNLAVLRADYGNAPDVNLREQRFGALNGALVWLGGMVNAETFAWLSAELQQLPPCRSPRKLREQFSAQAFGGAELRMVREVAEGERLLGSGFVLWLLEESSTVVAIGLTGYPVRSLSPPENEVNEFCAKEGFVESSKVNLTLLRRRIRSHALCAECITVGTVGQTEVQLVYLKGKVPETTLSQLRTEISSMELPLVLTGGMVRAFLSGEPQGVFSSSTLTERPDLLCRRLSEGRCGILVDGTPFAVVVPTLFFDHLQTMDDDALRPSTVLAARLLKMLAIMISIFLPGFYVACGYFHPEVYPPALIINLAAAEESTPFSLLTELLLMQIVFELMREAGLRLPRSVGHAVSIVGSVVIGSAAVSAGLIGAPTILVITLTVIAAYVVPGLRETMLALRVGMLLLGGWFGLCGIALGGAAAVLSLCAEQSYGTPLLSLDFPTLKRAFWRGSFAKEERR